MTIYRVYKVHNVTAYIIKYTNVCCISHAILLFHNYFFFKTNPGSLCLLHYMLNRTMLVLLYGQTLVSTYSLLYRTRYLYNINETKKCIKYFPLNFVVCVYNLHCFEEYLKFCNGINDTVAVICRSINLIYLNFQLLLIPNEQYQ